MRMPTLPLYDASAPPDGYRRVVSPGGYECWHFDVEDPNADRYVKIEFCEGDPASADYANAGPDSLKEVQVEATITDIDRNTGKVTLETTQFPGHEGKMTLAYRLTHLGGLVLYMEGEKVLANVVVTAEGPRVKSIGSD